MKNSPLREMMDDAGKCSYRPLASLQDAQEDVNGIAILEGDDGGQIYVVCPAKLIHCTEETLSLLLLDIDESEWPGNDPNMRRVYFESRKPGLGIPSGMGGALVTDKPWIHPRLSQRGFGGAINEVLAGRKQRMK